MADTLTTDNIDSPSTLGPLDDGTIPTGFVVVENGLLKYMTLAQIEAAITSTSVPAVPPTVELSLPGVDPDTLVCGVKITLLAAPTATSPATVSRVDFYIGSTKIGQATTAPWAYDYTPDTPQAGKRAFTAIVTDSVGQQATSNTLPVVITEPVTTANTPPVVTISVDTDAIAPGETVAIEATATDPEGIARLELYDYGVLVQSVTASPYTFSFLGATDNLGKHFFSIKAYDNLSLPGQSVGKLVTVKATTSTNTTPVAPEYVFDDAADTLVFTHALGNAEIVVSTNGGAYLAYTGPISVGNVNRAAGYYKAKTKAAPGRNESALTLSPQFNAAATVPGAPTGVAGTAGNNTVSVAFTAPASNGGATISSYNVYRNGGSTALGTATVSPYVDNTAQNNTAYTYRVAAVNSAGEGPKSTASSAVTPTAPTPVSYNTTLTGPSQTDPNGVTLTTDGGADTVEYDTIPSPSGTDPKRLDLAFSGNIVAAIDFLSAYLGQPLRYTRGSAVYNLTYTDGQQDL